MDPLNELDTLQWLTEISWHKTSAALYGYVVSGANIVDVDGDGGVSADPMFLHQRDEVRLGEVAGWGRLPIRQLHLHVMVQSSTAQIINEYSSVEMEVTL